MPTIDKVHRITRDDFAADIVLVTGITWNSTEKVAWIKRFGIEGEEKLNINDWNWEVVN